MALRTLILQALYCSEASLCPRSALQGCSCVTTGITLLGRQPRCENELGDTSLGALAWLGATFMFSLGPWPSHIVCLHLPSLISC